MRACSPKPNKKEWILHCCSASHIFSGVTEHHDRSSRKLLAPICNQHAFTHILIRERSAHTLRDILLTSTINYFSCGGGKQMLTKLLTRTHPTNNWACHLESLGARASTVPCSDRCLSALWGQLWASSTLWPWGLLAPVLLTVPWPQPWPPSDPLIAAPVSWQPAWSSATRLSRGFNKGRQRSLLGEEQWILTTFRAGAPTLQFSFSLKCLTLAAMN